LSSLGALRLFDHPVHPLERITSEFTYSEFLMTGAREYMHFLSQLTTGLKIRRKNEAESEVRTRIDASEEPSPTPR
jgi:hypothetical protein